MAFIGDTNIMHSNQLTGQPNHNKLDVTDAVVDTAPHETPLLAMIQRGKRPLDRAVRWQIDYLGAWPTSMGATRQANEGADANPTATQNRTFYGNNLHYFQDSFSVSHSHEAMDQYGLAGEVDHQNAKLAKQIIRDVEFAAHRSTIDEQSTGPNAGSDGLVRKMGGLIDQIENTGSYRVNGPALATAAQPYTAQITNDLGASSGTLTSGIVQTLMRNIWNNGGMPNGRLVGFANGQVKQIISELFAPNEGSSSIYRRTFGMDEARAIALPVDIIDTDFGTVELMLNRSVRDVASTTSGGATDDTGDLLVFDPQYVELRVLLDFQVVELAKVGSSYKYMQEWDGTICGTAPNTMGLLTGIQT